MDLMEGQVVRAVRGDRARYQPVRSRLCQDADPLRLARRLCEHCVTDTLYVADLDALRGEAVQIELLGRLLAAQPRLQLWLDAGFADAAAAGRLMDELSAWLQAHGPGSGSGAGAGAGSGTSAGVHAAGATKAARTHAVTARVTPVFGSESLRAGAALPPSRGILSLDSRGGARLGEPGVWEAASGWTGRLIVMTLERVGSAEGPDLEALRAIGQLAPRAMRIGAGGIRGVADLQAAAASGASAWLVASALHDGLIPAGWTVTDCGKPARGDDTLSQARDPEGGSADPRAPAPGPIPAPPPKLATPATEVASPAPGTRLQPQPTMAHALR